MENPDVVCRIWAVEYNLDGTGHHCHAAQNGLSGNYYGKSQISEILSQKSKWAHGTWRLAACEPNHDGCACENCQNRNLKGKVSAWGFS